jgi:hypothetical protein
MWGRGEENKMERENENKKVEGVTRGGRADIEV